jgi:hypothetical protein
MNRVLPALSACLLTIAAPAHADWTVLGAAYKCDAGKSFELRATVDTSDPSDLGTIRPAAGFTALKQDERSQLACNAGRARVQVVLHVWSPRATGMCAGSGSVSIESLLVNGKPVLMASEPFNMGCPTGPAVISVRVQGAAVRVCRGEWDWVKGFHSVRCSSTAA